MATSPLYDLYDPDGELRRLAELRAMRENPFSPYRESLSDLLPEEEKRGMLSRLADAGSSGIGALGWLLDTPGAVIRGGLSGGVGKAVSALTDTAEDRVTGRELLRQYGMVGEDNNWANWAGGLAAEIGLDPLTYLNPFSILGRGAYTTSGKALAKAGVLEDAALLARKQNKGVREYLRSTDAGDILTQYQDAFGRDASQAFDDAASVLGVDPAEAAAQRAAGSMEFRLPGMRTGYDVSLTGGYAGDAVAKLLDNAQEASKYVPGLSSLVNRTTRFFDTSVMGALDPESQWRNREAFAKTRNAQRDIREKYARLQYDAHNADVSRLPQQLQQADLQSFDSQRIQNAIADLIEAGGNAGKVIDQEAVNAINSVPEWRNVVDEFQGSINAAAADAKQRGVKLRKWEGESSFFPSQKRWFETEQVPDIPDGRLTKREQRYTSGQRALNLEDNLGRSRDPAYDLPMRRQALRQLMSGDSGRALQDKLLSSNTADAVQALEAEWARLQQSTGKMGRMYGGAEDAIQRTKERIAALEQQAAADGLPAKAKNVLTREARKLQKRLQSQTDSLAGYKEKLVDQLRMADRQFADQGLGLFDNSSFQDMLRYDLGRAKVNANADAIMDTLARIATQGDVNAVVGGGGITLTQAAKQLGFVPKQFKAAMQLKGIRNADEFLVTEKQIEDLKQLLPQGPQASDSPLSKLYRTFTNAFKIGALANPAYHTRNLYSGQYATASQGITGNPLQILSNAFAGFRAGRGDTAALLPRIRNIPRYKRIAEQVRAASPGISEDLVDQQVLREFQADFARNRLGQGQVVGDVEGAAEAPGLYLGAGATPMPAVGPSGWLYDKDRSWSDLFQVRGVDWGGVLSDRRAPQVTKNPLLALHEKTAQRVEDANRMGSYISALQEGASPDEAARLVFESQIDYSPEAFTAGEAALKRLVPFYSYPRGITPLVARNTIYRPGGLQGQTIRAINSAGQSNEDFFLPEYLRKEAAIPIPGAPEDSGRQRVLKNIDLPFVDIVNKFTPGTGNTYFQALLDSLQKTGVNFAGDLNPVPKMVIEGLFGKQLYSGRNLSDLYSVFGNEFGHDGRYAEQLFMNLVPGASKILPIYRTSIDDRLTPSERLAKLAVNNFTGVKWTDIDSEQLRLRAARESLQKLLETTSGANVYENINVPAEELASMGERERQLYLLYRVLQSDASARARERKAAEQDPLALLGIA